MKILVVSQPKTGNVWMRNLLARAYRLADLNEKYGDAIPETVPAFLEWIGDRDLPDGSIWHQHYFPKPELLKFARRQGLTLVTMLRNPYEAFVSFFFYVNRNPALFRGRPPEALLGRKIDDPEVLEFLAGPYRLHLNMSAQWVESGASHLVRYEDLLADTAGELARLTDRIQPLDRERVAEAVDHCSAERTRKRGGWKARHIRAASARTWDQHLSDAHLAIFNDRYGDLIRRMGYEVVQAVA